jgi:uncharacterized protein (DUF58 family)
MTSGQLSRTDSLKNSGRSEITGQRVVFALFLLSLIAGVATGGKIYYRLSVFWAILFFGSWLWANLMLRGLYFQRSARTNRAQVGQIFEERFEVQNTNLVPRLWVEIRDESSIPGSDGTRVLTMVEGRQGRSYLARTRLVQRGVFPLGPTILASGDVFGLFPVTRSYSAKDTLLVYPMMVEVRTLPNPPGLLPGGEALRRRTHQITPNASGVRDYYPGDPMNRIHWTSTARRNRLMVKEFELDPMADVWIFLDAYAGVQAALPKPPLDSQVGDFWKQTPTIPIMPSTEEYGVSAAASLVRAYLRRGRAVGLVAAGQQLTLMPPDRGGRQLGKILEALALLRAQGDLPLLGLVETQVKHMSRGSTVILTTPSVHHDISLSIDYLLQRGLRPVAVLLDASSFGGIAGTDRLSAEIRTLGVPVRVIKNGVNLEIALSNQIENGGRAAGNHNSLT